MASGAVYSAIKDYLAANWTTTPLAFENEETMSDGTALPPLTATLFVEVEISGTNYSQQSIGATTQALNRWDEAGILLMTVNVPKGTGSITGRTTAKSLADVFRGLRLLSDSIEFMDAYIGRGAPGPINGNYFQVPVDIEWRRVEA